MRGSEYPSSAQVSVPGVQGQSLDSMVGAGSYTAHSDCRVPVFPGEALNDCRVPDLTEISSATTAAAGRVGRRLIIQS